MPSPTHPVPPLAAVTPDAPRQTPPVGKIALLFALYVTQGLPYGFQSTALPVYLRTLQVPLWAIGLLGMLALPWMFKALWAPLVDRFYSPRFGRRRSWIVPMQAGLVLSCLAAAFVPVSTGLGLLLGLVFLMNLFAATQDIAVDGLAVDLLSDRELGPGNAAQVVGYKLGILTSSGALLWATAFIGWRGLFLAMAAITLAVLVVSLTYRETPPGTGAMGPARERQTLKDVLATLLRTLRLPGTPWLLAFIACYKIGEQMFTSMFKPYLVDAGFSPSRIGLWVGTYGMVFSIAGSLAGGWLAARVRLVRAVGIAALLRALPLIGAWLLTFEKVPPELHIIAVTCTEHFFAGVLTTSMFAFMMSRVDRSIGATHFTLLASVEVLGKSLGSMPSGFITGRYGYGTVFLLAWVLSVAYLALLWPRLARASEPPAVHAGA